MVVLNTDELFRYCIKNKKTLTPTRILIIRILSKFSKPQSAYDLLKEVNKEINPDLNISTVYRVLDFWMGIGLIHKISAINKYLVCLTPNEKHTHMLNFCTVCEKVIETCNKKMGLNFKKSTEKLNLSFNGKNSVEIPVICSECS